VGRFVNRSDWLFLFLPDLFNGLDLCHRLAFLS
jgi:hypothetical protein